MEKIIKRYGANSSAPYIGPKSKDIVVETPATTDASPDDVSSAAEVEDFFSTPSGHSEYYTPEIDLLYSTTELGAKFDEGSADSSKVESWASRRKKKTLPNILKDVE